MGLTYELINIDKKERISFFKIDSGTKRRELTGTIISSSLISYYMLTNIGDRISFVDDHSSEYFVFGEKLTWDEKNKFQDVTEKLVKQLVQEDIYVNKGKIWLDEEEGLYFHDLINIWDPKVNNKS